MSSEMEREAPETTATNELIHARNITSQQVMSPLACFANVTVSEMSKLKDSSNYKLWNISFLSYAGLAPPEFKAFVLDDTTHAGEVPGRNSTFESMLDHLVVITVSNDILEEVRDKSLIGKAAYLYIKDQYGVLQIHEQIQYITDLYDKILSNSVKFEKKMSYFNNIWKFLTKSNESERACLKHFIWIHQTSTSFEQHFKAQNPIISENELTKTIRIFPDLDVKTVALATHGSKGRASSEGQQGTSHIWGWQCFNCFGLGHNYKQCPSPRRLSAIPDVEEHMVRLIKKTLESYPKRQSTSDTDKKKVIYSKQSDNWGTNNNSGSTEFSKANTVMYANRVATNRDLFIIDTGASVTMVKSQDLLHDYIPFDEPRPVKAANDDVMEVLGQGTLICAVDDKQLHIPNVGYVPKLMQNLISAPALLNDDDTISMTSTALIHSRLGKIGILRDVCESIMSVVHSVPTVALAQSTSPLLLLHEVWGHPNNNAFKYMLRQQSYSYNENDLQFHCQSCLQGRQFQNIPNIATDDKALTPLDVIHADVIGPLPTSITGDMFALVVSDEYSRYMCCIPMQRKSDVSELLIILIHNMETHHQCQVRQLRSDNGGEFQNNQLKLFCETKGIQHTFITPHMHHQNGLAERANRSVQDKARVLMLQSKLPEIYWPYAYKTAAFLLNATPKQVLNNISPFELWFGKPVDYNLLKPFGIQCYAHIPQHYRSRLDPNGRLCILLGFPDNRKAYTLLDIEAGEVVDSSQVKFLDKYYDGEFPTVQQQSTSLSHGITAIPRTTTNIRDNSQEEHDSLSSTQSGEDTASHDNDTSSLDTPELSSLHNFSDINDPSDANLSSEESDHEDMQITPLDNLSWFHNDHSDF